MKGQCIGLEWGSQEKSWRPDYKKFHLDKINQGMLL
jgi:hypothetical protein